MAKKALIEQQKALKFQVRQYALPPVRSSALGVPRSASAGSACVRWRMPAAAGRQEGQLVRRSRTMTMTDPISDMLTRIRNTNVAMRQSRCRRRSRRWPSPRSSSEGYITSFAEADNGDKPGKTLTTR